MKKKQMSFTCKRSFSEYSGIGDVEYENYYECRHGSNCCDDDYCRCGKIVDERVENIKISELVKEICNSNDIIFRYCVWRLAVIHKLYEGSNWSVKVCGGYYGQEIDGISLENNEFVRDVEMVEKLSTNERLEYVLNKEYGFLLDSLKGKNYIIKSVDFNDLMAGNEGYKKKVDKNIYDQSYNLPIGIYLKQEDKYKLIDGYHRYVSLAKSGENLIISAE
jgi:hypothetical protein